MSVHSLRDRLQAKVLHFGLGNFHRAHQLDYFQNLADQTSDQWGVVSVNLRRKEPVDLLNAQNCFYHLEERSEEESKTKKIHSLVGCYYFGSHQQEVIDLAASEAIELLTFTVTEKAYSFQSEQPHLIYDALEKIAEKRKSPLTLISCDNLQQNSRVLKQNLLSYLKEKGSRQHSKIQELWKFPCSMVDRIVPKFSTDEIHRECDLLGIQDRALVITEEFSQWVIEKGWASPPPALHTVGVEFVEDVSLWEMKKLELLNAAHTFLAIRGLEAGLEFVHQAVDHCEIRKWLEQLWAKDLRTSFEASEYESIDRYTNRLLKRFSNSRLPHRLSQIACDSSIKIPQRWMSALDRGSDLLEESLLRWLTYISNPEVWPDVQDPARKRLIEIRGGRKMDANIVKQLKESLGFHFDCA